MLKRLAFTTLASIVAASAFAQANPRGEAKATVSGKGVSVEYGRPSLKGRDMLAQAEVGRAWRMGADDATSLKTEADLAFGDVKVPAGDYILTATRVDADRWHLNVLAKADRTKVADVPLSVSKLDANVETFTLELAGEGEKGKFKMMWGGTALTAGFTGK
jgi:hypothetical protein